MPEFVWALIGIAIGAGGTYGLLIAVGRNILQNANLQAEQIRENARKEGENKAKELELTAQKERLRLKEAFEKEAEAERKSLKEQEQRLIKREDTLDRKLDTLSVKEKNLEALENKLTQRDNRLAAKEKQLDQAIEEQRQKLLQITGLTPEAAKELLLKRIEEESRRDAGQLIQRVMDQAQEEAKEKSRQIILQAIQRYAAEQTSDHTVSTVAIPSDDMKGRVIGREGRNIRSFEKATGVDVIIDDTPGVVVVSCFDPVRREVARIALEKLVTDGRIHPARIEELVAQTSKEMEEELVRIGREAVQETNLPNVPKAIIPMLGRLGYRTSYGQNVLRHSIEVAYLSQVIANELGLDGNLARRAGLFHDIGKAMDHEQEGGHPQIGMEFLRRFNEPEAVLNAALAHHGDVPATTPYTPIVQAADAISASRPGARRESLERYIKRLQELEELAKGFQGVRQAYAIQAGREVRVIVDAKQVDDAESAKIARDIAKKVEDSLQYPGEIKVTLIREVRSVE
ncbi:MAG: ribonuclease Y, partial [Bacillota bacterium]